MRIKCCWSQVSQDLPFLHPSETSVLNRLCKMGTDYVRFTEFIEQHTGHVHQQVIRVCSACIVCEGRDQIKSSSCLKGALLQPAESDWASWHLPAGVLHRAQLHAATLSAGFIGPWKRGFTFEGLILLLWAKWYDYFKYLKTKHFPDSSLVIHTSPFLM